MKHHWDCILQGKGWSCRKIKAPLWLFESVFVLFLLCFLNALFYCLVANTCWRLSVIHFSSCFAFFLLLCSLHISLTSLPRAPPPLPTSYLLEDKNIQFSQFSVYWQKVKSASHSMSLNSERWKRYKDEQLLWRDKFVKEFRSFWSS